MARIAIGGFHHETNTFAASRATFEDYLQADGWPALARGVEMPEMVAGVNLPITGFIDAARADGHELVPLVWCNAGPSGPVTRDAYERIARMLADDLAAAGPVDALFLDLHGAMVTEHLDDGEGELLARLRTLLGARPLVAALDLHANVSDAMVAHADRLVAYRTYPHVDLAQTGTRCAIELGRLLRGDAPLAKAHRKPPFLIPLPWQSTDLEPAAGLYRQIERLEAETGVSLSLCMGFPAADIPDCGPSVIAYGTDRREADALCDVLTAQVLAAEERFAGRLWSPEEAVAHAIARRTARPVVLADTQDNPGGGGSADTTGLLRALVEAGAEDAVLALLHDPDAAVRAHRSGVGATIVDLPLGGRHGPLGVEPLVVDVVVEALGDGRFTATGPMYRGSRMDLGPMANLRIRHPQGDGVRVLVSSRRVQAADRAIFRHLGVEPAAERILGLKSSVHFRADFAPIAEEILVVVAPGAVVADPARLPFRRLRPELRQAPGYRPDSL